MNKNVFIRGTKYQMYDNATTHVIFVRSRKSGSSYPVADFGETEDGLMVVARRQDAMSEVSNQELVEAWLS